MVTQVLQTILRRTGLQSNKRLATQASCSFRPLRFLAHVELEFVMHESPLDELNETALYQLLGDAWYAQFAINNGLGHFLPSSVDVGKREFDAVASVLTEALRQPYFHGVPARVASALKVEATWRMPASVVAALARHRGMITPHI
jgi:hypothetical protein